MANSLTLELRDLKRSFRTPEGSANLIVDVRAFELAPGAQRAVRGGSGSGKTTFLNLIAGILAADAGVVRIGGEQIYPAPEAVRDRIRGRSIGYIFQTFNLLQGYTALENVELAMRFGAGVRHAAARELLARVGLSDRLHYYPRQLSVGQQQRVAVARALANHPKLVLADEPTGNLDFRLAGQAIALIREICRENDAALLLVSHDRDVLAQFDDVADFAALNHAASAAVDVATGASQ